MKLWPLASALFVCLASFIEAGPAQSIQKVNELTLARIQPGKDTLDTAKQRMRAGYDGISDPKPGEKFAKWAFWTDVCAHVGMTAELDEKGIVQSVSVFRARWMMEDCFDSRPKPPLYSHWMTGRGLRLWHPKSRAIGLYGHPSRTGISKDGEERLLFLFEDAGRGEPQALEVRCADNTVTRIALYSKDSRLLADLKAEGIGQ